MHRFLRFSIVLMGVLMGLFAAVSSYAADTPLSAPMTAAPMTEDQSGPEIEQPIEFPHFRHAGDPNKEHPEKGGMQINCMYCHTFARRSAVAGIPPLQKCIGCHQSIESVRETPRIKKLFEYWEGSADGKIAARTPVPWKKVHDLPDFVSFSHERHVQRFVFQQGKPAQEVCAYCHGDVKTMTVARRSKSLSMGWCVSCHEKDHLVDASSTNTSNGPNDCWQCHK